MRKELRQAIEMRLHKYSQLNESDWNNTIAQQVKHMPRQQQQLFCMRYIEKKSEKEICNELHIERATYYNWINSMINEIAIAAAYERLIEP